ncbi:MAG TPA: M23 family metallopeptidase [Syntrophomonadaceae bacterium]|nr:M23 family metallopeptidase [Syntrophomonadaceae bacterium]
MLSRFKLRLLLVILVVAMASISMRSNENRSYVKPVLEYVLHDYGIEQKIHAWSQSISSKPEEKSVTAFNGQELQVPCAYLSVQQAFGWYWNSTAGQQQFSSGLRLKVPENTVVKPVTKGRVVELGNDDSGRTVLLQHGQNLYSLYGGLKEVLVDQSSSVAVDQALGKSGSSLYLEIRGPDGPLDPQSLLE